MRLIAPDDPRFEQACFGPMFNVRHPRERVPAAVLQATSDQDVIDGVRFAHERGWQVSVRAGGHSWAGWSVRDGALLIDLGAMREMTFDAATGVATVEPRDPRRARARAVPRVHGRMLTGGHCESVGLGGFLLQGGQGWNSRRWGWGCENVVGFDVVTADGELLHC